MASQEDEEAKKRVQEAVWAWTQRLLVLAVVFGFGFFAGVGTLGLRRRRALRTCATRR